MRVYRIQWRNGNPWVEPGSVIHCGKNKKLRRIQFPSEAKTVAFERGSATIVEAIEAELLHIALIFGPSVSVMRASLVPRPWLMARCVAEILRLYRKLERHGLVPKGTYEKRARKGA